MCSEDAPRPVHHSAACIGDLAFARTSLELINSLNEMEQPACCTRMAIGQQSAMGIARQPPTDRKFSRRGRGTSFSLIKEAHRFEFYRDSDGEGVVDFDKVDVGGSKPCPTKGPRR